MLRTIMLTGVLCALASSCTRQAKLEKLCARVEALACDDATLGFKVADRMTLVAGNLSEESPVYADLFAGVLTAAPADRHGALVKAVSAELGRPWSCPMLDGLWENREDLCVKR